MQSRLVERRGYANKPTDWAIDLAGEDDLNTSFEVIALGAGFQRAQGAAVRSDIPQMTTRFATGLATQDRLVKTLPLGRALMSDPPVPVPAATWD